MTTWNGTIFCSAALLALAAAAAGAPARADGSYTRTGPHGTTTANWSGNHCCWAHGGAAAGAAVAGLAVGAAAGVAAASHPVYGMPVPVAVYRPPVPVAVYRAPAVYVPPSPAYPYGYYYYP